MSYGAWNYSTRWRLLWCGCDRWHGKRWRPDAIGDLAVISYLVTVIDSIVGCCVSDIAQGWWCDIDPPQTCTCWFSISM
jgi:hypothetical protein